MEVRCSAIIPVFNSGSYVIEAIDSLLQQNVKLTKIVVIDDCSTDGTLALITERYSEQIQAGLILIHRLLDNVGVSNARNIGVSLVDTEWVLFLDADDVLQPDAVQFLQNKALELNDDSCRPYHLIHSAYQLIDKDSCIVSPAISWKQVRFDETLGWAFYRNHISTSGLLVNCDGFRLLGGFDCSLSRSEDWELWLRFAHYSGVGYVEKTLTSVRRHDSNVSANLADMLTAERAVLSRYSIEDIKLAIMKRSCSEISNISDFISILFRLDEFERGYFEAKQAINQLADSSGLRFFTGLFWIKNKDFEKAVVEFQNCISGLSSNGALLNNLGAAYLCLGSKARAIGYFDKALQLYPNYIDAIKNKSLVVEDKCNIDLVRFTWRELRPVLTNYTN